MGTLAAGIKEIFATAKTTGSNVMLCGNDGTPDGHIDMANLASVLGGVNTQEWTGGSFENMLRLNRQGVYYVDKDHNGEQSDMPFAYCIISVNLIPYVQNNVQNNDVQAQAFAFDITTGSVKYKCVSGIGSSRDYPWKDVPVGLPAFYQSYADLSSLANALGGVSNVEVKKRIISDDNHEGALLVLQNNDNTGFGISFRLGNSEVGWLGYEVSDGKLHWNDASGSHIIAFTS